MSHGLSRFAARNKQCQNRIRSWFRSTLGSKRSVDGPWRCPGSCINPDGSLPGFPDLGMGWICFGNGDDCTGYVPELDDADSRDGVPHSRIGDCSSERV